MPADAYRSLDPRTPIALLPLRLETRYFERDNDLELRVRIFPDALHVTGSRRDPSPAEVEATRAYWTSFHSAGRDALATRSSEQRLITTYGRARAEWLQHAFAPTVGADGQLTFPNVPSSDPEPDAEPTASPLPNRFALVGLAGIAQQFVVWGASVPSELPVGPVAASSTARWQVDFEVAESLGMAMRVTLAPEAAAVLTQLVVLGLREGEAPAASASAFADLIERHATEAGAALLPVGTTTNHTPAGRAEPRPSRTMGTSTPVGSDGERICQAFGLAPSAMSHVAGADAWSDANAKAINRVTWSATIGHFLDLIAPVGASSRGALRDLFVEHVRARGPFPVLCVGRQPYGLLPVGVARRGR